MFQLLLDYIVISLFIYEIGGIAIEMGKSNLLLYHFPENRTPRDSRRLPFTGKLLK